MGFCSQNFIISQYLTEEELRRAFGEKTEGVIERERREDVGEEAVPARARRAGAAPGETEAEEHNLNHTVFRSWRPHCVTGRAESRGHVKKVQDEGETPTVGVEKKPKGMPIVVATHHKTKMIIGRVVPSNGVEGYAVETANRMVQR